MHANICRTREIRNMPLYNIMHKTHTINKGTDTTLPLSLKERCFIFQLGSDRGARLCCDGRTAWVVVARPVDPLEVVQMSRHLTSTVELVPGRKLVEVYERSRRSRLTPCKSSCLGLL